MKEGVDLKWAYFKKYKQKKHPLDDSRWFFGLLLLADISR